MTRDTKMTGDFSGKPETARFAASVKAIVDELGETKKEVKDQTTLRPNASSSGSRPKHFMRRTKASLIYKATGNLRAIQILLGRSKIENSEISWRGRRQRARAV